tara:strand:- start:236 stop:1099 length:864 start_codon:yes stop_codon:yes gene_type:complete
MSDVYDSILFNSFNKYKLCEKIGNGKFGKVYLGYNLQNKKEVAIKTESFKSNCITLKNEAKIMRYLTDNKCREIPTLYWYGKVENNLILIMSKYDCSLFDYIKNSKEISISNANYIMVKMIYIIEAIHDLFVVHRDIKPHHFMIRNNQIVLIDFGISTFYVDEEKQHINNDIKSDIIGTPNYASYFVHQGNTYSRRDDLLSIAYIYFFILRYELPWENINVDYHTDQSICSILHPKNKKIEILKELPDCVALANSFNNNFGIFLEKIYNLEFNEEPRYVDYLALFYY